MIVELPAVSVLANISDIVSVEVSRYRVESTMYPNPEYLLLILFYIVATFSCAFYFIWLSSRYRYMHAVSASMYNCISSSISLRSRIVNFATRTLNWSKSSNFAFDLRVIQLAFNIYSLSCSLEGI